MPVRILPPVKPPSDFPVGEDKLPNRSSVVISKVKGKELMWADCKTDGNDFYSSDMAVCDLVGVHRDKGEVVFGKVYIWDGGEKYYMVLPKFFAYYSGYDDNEIRPYDSDNLSTARFVVVEKR